ncbi:heme-binding protein [Pseudomonas sp. MWU16-30317]|uniref:heme-binding protein n=1 Tax=Pseudomonas sp. MWU16-30317 TaxID=2878095 RepID=UPI0031F9C398
MEGGVPVLIDGKLVGAVGVAGGLSPEDGTFAEKTAAMMGKHWVLHWRIQATSSTGLRRSCRDVAA